jgi:hypothetical protein
MAYGKEVQSIGLRLIISITSNVHKPEQPPAHKLNPCRTGRV